MRDAHANMGLTHFKFGVFEASGVTMPNQIPDDEDNINSLTCTIGDQR